MENDTVEAPKKRPRSRKQVSGEKPGSQIEEKSLTGEGWQPKEGKPITTEQLIEAAKARDAKEGAEKGGASDQTGTQTYTQSMASGRREAEKRIRRASGKESGGNGQPTQAKQEPGHGSDAETEDLNEVIDKAKKYMKNLSAGWYPQKSRDGTLMFLRNPKTEGKTNAIPYSEELWKVWTQSMTEDGKKAYEADSAAREESAGGGGGKKEHASDFLESPADKATPVLRGVLQQMSWYQGVCYKVGHMTFHKLLAKAQHLLPPDLWELNLAQDPAHADTVAVGMEYAREMAKVIDLLLESQDPETVKALQGQITMNEAHILLLQKKVQEQEWNLDYWKRYGRLATSLMTTDQQADFFRRMDITTQLEAQARGMEMLNARNANAKEAVVPPPEAVST